MKKLFLLLGIIAALSCGGAMAQVTILSQAQPSTTLSGTVAVGGTFQTAAGENRGRKSIDFVNICNVTGKCTATTNFCYLYMASSGTPSTNNSIPVAPGVEYLRATGIIPADSIRITCDGNADKFYLEVQ